MTKESLFDGETTPVETATPPETTTQPEQPQGIEIKYPENFPEEFRGNPNVMKFVDKESGEINYGNALTSLIHAQKLVGADKMLVPSKTATDDDWNEVFRKLGNPEKVDDYKIDLEGFNADDPLSKGFIETAHKSGVLPRQAAAIAKYFKEAQAQTAEQEQALQDDSYQEELNSLKQEWGDKWEANKNKANNAFKTIFSAEEQEFYKEKGLLSDPVFLKAMNKVSQSMQDDTTFNPKDEGSTASVVDAMKQSYRESYAIVLKGDRTNPSYEHHKNNLHKLNEKAGSMGISLV